MIWQWNELSEDLRESITERLARRGLRPIPEIWEVHGPHPPELTFEVWIGQAQCRHHPKEWMYVAIYPRRVYALEDPSDWGRPDPDSQLYAGETACPRCQAQELARKGWDCPGIARLLGYDSATVRKWLEGGD